MAGGTQWRPGNAMNDRARALRWPLAIARQCRRRRPAHQALGARALDDGRAIDLVGPLRFNLAFNTGMAFSQGEGIGRIVPILAISVVAALLMAVGRSSSRWFSVGVG